MIFSKEIQDSFIKELEQDLKKLLVEEVKTTNYNKKEGIVISFRDGVAVIDGLEDARIGQKILFYESTDRAKQNNTSIKDVFGQIIDIDEYSINCIVFGEERFIKQGDKVILDEDNIALTVRINPKNILGKVIDPFGNFKFGENETSANPSENNHFKDLEIEVEAPKLIHRAPITEPMFTGIKAIDTMFPIGHGQRMLLIGDRGTGKTQICLDTISHNANHYEDKDTVFVYVAIGKRKSEIANIISSLKLKEALKNTIIVSTDANDPAALLYIAPFAGCSIAEYFRDLGRKVVIFYDDLSKHANAYRHISLLLERTPGREAYPGDIFYLHSRLLERSAAVYLKENTNQFGTYLHCSESENVKIGTLTALPVIETKENDFSAYIPTNVISITDGQIYLDKNLFNENILPAINTGLSVSRIGAKAQDKLKVFKSIKSDLANFREKEKYQKFGFEMNADDQKIIDNGKKLIEIMKQEPFKTVKEEDLVSELIKIYPPKEDTNNKVSSEKIK
jgi:proton translocating ATP synthase F1 alpha subunit